MGIKITQKQTTRKSKTTHRNKNQNDPAANLDLTCQDLLFLTLESFRKQNKKK